MASVKGSRQDNMVVVPKRFWHEPWGRWSLGVFGLFICLVFFLLGQFRASVSGVGGSAFALGAGTNATLVSELQAEVVKAEQAATVDRLALQDLRINIGRLREQISQLEEDVLFYKQIADSDRGETGLVVSQLDLITTEQPAHFRYKLKFEQLGNKSNTIEGYANIAITGVKDDRELTLPLGTLSNSLQGESIKLRFRSFQDVEGELSLPYGFEPARFEILVVTEEPDSQTLQKNFGWLVESDQHVITK